MKSCYEISLIPLLSLCFLLLYKSYNIAFLIDATNISPLFLTILSQDLPFIFLLIFLLFASSQCKSAFSVLFLLVFIFLNLVYAIDVYLLINLDHHLTISAIRTYSKDILSIDGLVNFRAIIYLLITIFLASIPYPKISLKKISPLSLSLFFLLFQDAGLNKYRFPPKQERKFDFASSFFSSKQAKKSVNQYRRDYKVEIPDDKPNIILLVVESFSASFSNRTSGIENLTPRIDEISKDGILFTNFFANYEVSEGALVALLNAAPPLAYPGSKQRMMKSYAFKPSIVESFRENQYHLQAIFGIDSRFADSRMYLKSLGFHEVFDKKNYKILENLPQQTMNAVPDHYLFDKYLSTYGNLKSPNFTLIFTTSSHKPWIDPEGVENSKQKVWSYVDREILDFYEKLQKLNFFEKGVLIITGDHRSPTPLSLRESSQYGESARFRVPLIIVGKNFDKNKVDDRVFQQSDLFRKLNLIINPKIELSKYVFGVSTYTRNVWDDKKIGHFRIFDLKKNDNSEGFAFGNKLIWLKEPNSKKIQIENTIQTQRAAFQYLSAQNLCFENKEQKPNLKLSGVVQKRNSLNFILNSFDSINSEQDFTLSSYLKINSSGYYWFEIPNKFESCVQVDNHVLFNQKDKSPFSYREYLFLNKGLHLLRARVRAEKNKNFFIKWKDTYHNNFTAIPSRILYSPKIKNSKKIEDKKVSSVSGVFISPNAFQGYFPLGTDLELEEKKKIGYNNVVINLKLNHENKLATVYDSNDFLENVVKLNKKIKINDPWVERIRLAKAISLKQIIQGNEGTSNFIFNLDQIDSDKLVELLLDDLKDARYKSRIYISSNRFELLRVIKEKLPEIRVLYKVQDTANLEINGIDGIIVPSKKLIKRISLPVLVFVDNIIDDYEYKRAKKIADYLITSSDFEFIGNIEPNRYFNLRAENVKIYNDLSEVDLSIISDRRFKKLELENKVYFIKTK